mmetsp:Transcript_85426/g.204719  ORF Transcript_85426/g.204719 Transcript_85426/m.204719 type:complete len:207 (-) Transcript_85426:873-1493(-)
MHTSSALAWQPHCPSPSARPRGTSAGRSDPDMAGRCLGCSRRSKHHRTDACSMDRHQDSECTGWARNCLWMHRLGLHPWHPCQPASGNPSRRPRENIPLLLQHDAGCPAPHTCPSRREGPSPCPPSSTACISDPCRDPVFAGSRDAGRTRRSRPWAFSQRPIWGSWSCSRCSGTASCRSPSGRSSCVANLSSRCTSSCHPARTACS